MEVWIILGVLVIIALIFWGGIVFEKKESVIIVILPIQMIMIMIPPMSPVLEIAVEMEVEETDRDSCGTLSFCIVGKHTFPAI
ncbi:hypothetical protein GCM10020331_072470 [Ectobacillus funiculus]